MRSLYQLVCTFSLLTFPVSATSVPPELSGGFEPDEITLTVGYNGNGLDSFTDGSTLSTSEVSKAPLFGLGDSSGINTQIEFLIAMVDSTDPENLVLHFLQARFSADGDETGIASTTTPAVRYEAPGAFGETGRRQYSFLLFQQTQPLVLGLPNTAQTFDLAFFEDVNDLQPALAGLAMFVDLDASSSTSIATSSSSGSSSAQSSAQTLTTQASTTVQSTSSSTAAAVTASITTATTTTPASSSTSSAVVSSSSASVTAQSTTTTTTSSSAAAATASTITTSSSHSAATSTTISTPSSSSANPAASVSFILSSATASAGSASVRSTSLGLVFSSVVGGLSVLLGLCGMVL